MRIHYDCGLILEINDGSGSIVNGLPREPDAFDPFDDSTQYNAAMDGIESFILALACAGVNVTSPAFVSSLDTALEACGNNL